MKTYNKTHLKEKDTKKIDNILEIEINNESNECNLDYEDILEIDKPKNIKNKKNKKKFEIIFPEEILDILEKIIKSQNQDLLNIIGQNSIIDYTKFKKCLKEDKKVLIEK